MKSFIRFLFVLALAFGHTANAGPAGRYIEGLPKLSVPKAISLEHWNSAKVDPVEITKDGNGVLVSYWVYDSKQQLSIKFIADGYGDLKGFRIIQVDTTVFSWGKCDNVSEDNKVNTDVGAWKSLFYKKVVLNRVVTVQ